MRFLARWPFVLLFLFALSADASWIKPGTKPFQLSPFFGYRFGGSFENAATGDSISIRSAPAYGLVLDIGPEGGPEKLQLIWSRQDTELSINGFNGNSDPEVTIDYFGIGGMIEFENYEVVPYFSMTIGATHFDAGSLGSDTRFSFGLGGGFKYFPGDQERFAIRLDARAYGTVTDGGGLIFCSNGGCVINFSGSALLQGEVSAGVTLAF